MGKVRKTFLDDLRFPLENEFMFKTLTNLNIVT